jgi:glutamine phosphoribosylpyrophosphate amidotransferase
MCGIAGWSASPTEKVHARSFARALLMGVRERGGHATGAAFFEGGRAYVQKGPIRTERFVHELDMGPSVPTAVLHTRYATKGSRHVNANNHPIEIPGRVLGVHNGCVRNDDALFEEIGADKRIAEVDSEAIFAALTYLDGKPEAALSKVRGSAAVAWIEPEGDQYTLHAARISSSPLVYGFTKAGSFVFASTRWALASACREVGLDLADGPHDLPEGTYLRVRAGVVVAKRTFAVEQRTTGLSALERRALNLA